MNYNRLFGPKEKMEIILCQYEDDRVFYQFNGMDGRPCEPAAIHHLLMRVAAALTQPARSAPPETFQTDPLTHLLPEDIAHV